jgi:hypothetical protein
VASFVSAGHAKCKLVLAFQIHRRKRRTICRFVAELMIDTPAVEGRAKIFVLPLTSQNYNLSFLILAYFLMLFCSN